MFGRKPPIPLSFNRPYPPPFRLEVPLAIFLNSIYSAMHRMAYVPTPSPKKIPFGNIFPKKILPLRIEDVVVASTTTWLGELD